LFTTTDSGLDDPNKAMKHRNNSIPFINLLEENKLNFSHMIMSHYVRVLSTAQVNIDKRIMLRNIMKWKNFVNYQRKIENTVISKISKQIQIMIRKISMF